MKFYFRCILFLIPLFGVFGNSNINGYVNDYYTFNTMQLVKQKDSDSTLNYRVTKYKVSHLAEQTEKERSVFLNEYFGKNKKITERKLLKYLKSDQTFVIQKYNAQPVNDYSYKKVYAGKNPVGECHLVCSTEPYMDFAGYVEYRLLFLDGDDIVKFYLRAGYLNKEMDVLESLPEIFYKKDGKWYWKSEEAMVELCKMMENHDERLPVEMLELQLKWEEIIGNLEVDGKKITLK